MLNLHESVYPRAANVSSVVCFVRLSYCIDTDFDDRIRNAEGTFKFGTNICAKMHSSFFLSKPIFEAL